MNDSVTDSAADPVIRIDPTATAAEIAVVTVVLGLLSATGVPDAPVPPSAWAASARTPQPQFGPGASWLRSAAPDRQPW